jgi:hypothetical protein
LDILDIFLSYGAGGEKRRVKKVKVEDKKIEF